MAAKSVVLTHRYRSLRQLLQIIRPFNNESVREHGEYATPAMAVCQAIAASTNT
jgi:hypothetical protein